MKYSLILSGRILRTSDLDALVIHNTRILCDAYSGWGSVIESLSIAVYEIPVEIWLLHKRVLFQVAAGG